MHICLIGAKSYGLWRDLCIVAGVLRSAGHAISYSVPGVTSLWTKLYREGCHRVLRARPYDVNLHVGPMIPRFFPYARRNYLIPNQEAFQERFCRFLPEFDAVLCKTRHAVEVFGNLGARVEYLGFTSEDHGDPSVPKDMNRFLHLCSGKLKGTRAVLEAWQRHPEWPPLTVIQSPKIADIPHAAAPNIDHRVEYVDDKVILELQNGSGVHLCPSEAEGFGHYIVEAMSCGALVVTTDGPPMNELITPERGVLVGHDHAEPSLFGVRYQVGAAMLEQRIEDVLRMPPDERKRLGENARKWFEDSRRAFAEKLLAVVEQGA